MLSRIVRHEWRGLAADATVWIVAGVFAVAIGYGVWNGARAVGFQHRALAEAAAEEASRLAGISAQLMSLKQPGAQIAPFADPRSPSNFGGRYGLRYAMLPPGPLAALSIGQSDLLPHYFKISTDARENIVSASEIENPARLLAGRFDLSFVVIYLYPLLILALTYNMLSAEKEQGTLAIALSQPIGLDTLLAGKVALRSLIIIGAIVLFSIAALVVSGASLTPGSGIRVLMWVGAVAAYGLFWFALASAVVSSGWNSTTNATILATAWLVLVVMTPSLFNLVVTLVYPVPSRVEMVQAMREASDEANKAGSSALARYYEDHPELATGDPAQAMNDFNIVRVAVNDDVERRVRPVVDRYEAQIAAQQRALDRLRFLSPAILMQGALNDVAGTGTDRHRHFLGQVDEFHAAWRAHFVSMIFSKAVVQSVDEAPRFVYQEETLAMVASRVAKTIAGLLIPSAAIAWYGWRRVRRFPIVT